MTRGIGEGWREDCLMPRLRPLNGSCMVWAAIWHGGRSQLYRFDVASSEGQRGGVTGAIYCDQIIKGELKRVWNHVRTWWRGYGTPRIVEDGAPVHTAAG